MCGIAGIMSKKSDLIDKKDLVWKISNSLKMRGPDSHGEFIEHDAILIHRRLSVIDVEKGSQPMKFGKYVIVYNGELYNTNEVRDELKSYGYTFETSCDTEVVLKAFDKWQEHSCEKFNGIFAYAVYNIYTKELFLCRDRIGVKPLYYAQTKNYFAFASRIKSLLYVDGIEPKADADSLNEIFMLGPAKTIGKTVFSQIKELPPACYMYFKDGKSIIKEYWKLRANEFDDDFETALEKTKYLVSDAIERQLVSDVPLCTFLSGGLDSSIISMLASKRFKDNNKQLNTYSVDYIDNDQYFKQSVFQPNKDSDYIDLISNYIGSNHHNIMLNNIDVADALIDSTFARNTPGFTDIDSSLLLFCKEVKKDYTVCLSGECADEIFGGYPWYHNKDILFDDTFPWSKSTNVRKSILKDGVLKNADEYVRNAYLSTINSTDYLDGESTYDRRMREMFKLNLDWFMQTLLTRKDVMSMQASLEVRVPFCDYRLVEYAYNMPWDIKSFNNREKGILRKAFENDLPEEITWRKKSPYPKTFNPIYFDKVCEMVKFVLDDKECILNGILNKQQIYNLIQNPNSLTEPWYGQLMRTPQVLAYIVQIYVWIKKYSVEFD